MKITRHKEDGSIVVSTEARDHTPIPKELALNPTIWEYHYTGGPDDYTPCNRVFGPRGGVTDLIIRARRNSGTKVWVRSPERWQFSVKHGLGRRSSEHGIVDNTNAGHFHAAKDCPLLKRGPETRDAALTLLGEKDEVSDQAEGQI